MASLESAIRAMLLTGTSLSTAGVADDRATHGYRLQNSALPALTYGADETSLLTIGANSLRRARAEVRVVADTTAAALAFVPIISALCAAGTYDTIVFQSVLFEGHAVEPAAAGDGDENQPAELVCWVEIIYED